MRHLFFLDLDGTLLDDDKNIPPENAAAVRLALDRGCGVVLTSGRPLVSVLKQARCLGLDGPGCYVIAYNGAVVYDGSAKREIVRRTLAWEDLYALFDEAGRRGVYIQTYDGDRVAVEAGADTSLTERYCQGTGMEFCVVDSVRDLREPPVKALLIDFQGRDATEPMRRWINETLGQRVVSYFSSAYYVEIVPAGVDKGRAVVDLCELLGVPVEDAVAVGDEANDIPMLRAAGLGAAMANAAVEVKAAADTVTRLDNNHGGAAEIIRRVLDAD